MVGTTLNMFFRQVVINIGGRCFPIDSFNSILKRPHTHAPTHPHTHTPTHPHTPTHTHTHTHTPSGVSRCGRIGRVKRRRTLAPLAPQIQCCRSLAGRIKRCKILSIREGGRSTLTKTNIESGGKGGSSSNSHRRPGPSNKLVQDSFHQISS